ncbi:DUF4124 domain-containing protein [Microbulbifer pacificus]|uniref:DUF4124 domain-containing protein n=1 Tax=Microbulbifer pacificus TaxID=407164 RepID=UPI0018F8A0EE|nr:DUF4124 domain-containing protein [Microbulbifer pacificus]
MTRRIALLALLLAAPVMAFQEAETQGEKAPAGTSVYKIVGPDGRVTFSDTAPAGSKAEKIRIGPINVQPTPLPERKLSPRDREEREGDDGEREERSYAQGPVNFAIVSPANDATIPPGQRFIVLQVAMDPVPRDGYAFYAVIDGQRWSGTSSGASLDISALERGTHTIQAVLVDTAGRPLAQSQMIQVHVKRPGGQVPDFPAEQAPQMPKAPQVPGIANPPKPQPR